MILTRLYIVALTVFWLPSIALSTGWMGVRMAFRLTAAAWRAAGRL